MKINFRLFSISFLLFIISFSLVSCGSNTSPKPNVILINNSSTNLNKFTHTTFDSTGTLITRSGGASYADNSFIKPKDSLKFTFESSFFKVGVVDKNNITHESQKFNINFDTQINLPVKISATIDSSGNWIFTRIN